MASRSRRLADVTRWRRMVTPVRLGFRSRPDAARRSRVPRCNRAGPRGFCIMCPCPPAHRPALTEAQLPDVVADLAARDAATRRDRRALRPAAAVGPPRASPPSSTSSSSSRSRSRRRRPPSTASSPRPTPDTGAFLPLADAELLAIGFSRQKARYVRALARRRRGRRSSTSTGCPTAGRRRRRPRSSPRSPGSGRGP